MSRRIHARVITAAALAATLSLTNPVHTAGLGGWQGSSGWLLDAWHRLAGAWPGTGEISHGAGAKAASSLLKARMGVDPDGHSLTGTKPDASITPTPDRGMGVDPDG